MPNHVTTRCIVTGPANEIKRFRATIICVPPDETDETLDFNRITPMSQILKGTVPGSNASLGIEILTGKPKPGIFNTSYLAIPWVQDLGISTISELRAWAEKERPKALEEGRKAMKAYNETGFYDWYDWSIAMWGTKWNSYAFNVVRETEGELSFHFDTAWDFPTPIFDKLAEMFPILRFECSCFDEFWNFAGQGAFNGDTPSSSWSPQTIFSKRCTASSHRCTTMSRMSLRSSLIDAKYERLF